MIKTFFIALLLFIVTVIPVAGIAQSPALPGYYRAKSGCPLSIRITKSGKQYFYVLKQNTGVKKGKLKIVKADEPGTMGIVLTGIRWAEYAAGRPPVGLEGIWTTAGITIQNYGNAMNSYTKLAACGEKYIELSRQ
jgi:hypothetical protein